MFKAWGLGCWPPIRGTHDSRSGMLYHSGSWLRSPPTLEVPGGPTCRSFFRPLPLCQQHHVEQLVANAHQNLISGEVVAFCPRLVWQLLRRTNRAELLPYVQGCALPPARDQHLSTDVVQR